MEYATCTSLSSFFLDTCLMSEYAYRALQQRKHHLCRQHSVAHHRARPGLRCQQLEPNDLRSLGGSQFFVFLHDCRSAPRPAPRSHLCHFDWTDDSGQQLRDPGRQLALLLAGIFVHTLFMLIRVLKFCLVLLEPHRCVHHGQHWWRALRQGYVNLSRRHVDSR